MADTLPEPSPQIKKRMRIPDLCIVVNAEGTTPIFEGSTEDTVKWLEDNESFAPRWVYVRETADILTESQFLDLAS